MGILVDSLDKSNILTEHDFKHKGFSRKCKLYDCYERCIRLTDHYVAWIAVQINTGIVSICVDYVCGDKVKDYNERIEIKWEDSPEQFFEKLDDIVTNIYKSYSE